ncbi:hypothetical protein AB4Y87_25605 [Paenarthrobacter sp. RAF54_2]|uniref:hypothetical protein n=1 Tax=Paenarthrobacter sp. RAF54_2 TaxID=3233061 RepID=UPI003F9724D8
MPKMGVGAPWNRFELTDVGIPAEYVRDLSELVKAANSSTSPAQAKYQRTPSQQWF